MSLQIILQNPCSSLLALLLIGLAYLLLRPVYVYFRDPLNLRRFPAPDLLAAMTPIWMMRATWSGKRYAWLHREHERLGDVVRIGPSHLSFNDPRAVADIYGHQAASKIGKDVFYDTLAGQYHDVFQSTDRAEHSRKRKYIANSFSLKNVVRMEPLIRDNIRILIARIDEWCGQQDNAEPPLDLRRWFNYLTFDVIGSMAFSQPFGFLRNRADSKVIEGPGEQYEVPSVIDALIFGLRFNVTVAQLSTSLQTVKTVKALVRSIPRLPRWLGADKSVDFDNVCKQHLRRRIEKPVDASTDDFIQSILTDRNGEDRRVPFMELFAESGVIIGAGSATTTGALSSSCYLLASHPQCLARLRKEVDSVMPFAAGDHSELDQEIVPYDLIKNLPYLRAVIEETLRLRPPISFALPRRVYAPEGADIAGHHVGQGTIVAVPPYTIHRKASLYSDPEAFKPERWFQEEGNFDPEKESEIHNLKTYTIPFSQGSRACIGRHIAVVEVQILLATIVRRYDISLVSKDQQLDIFEQFNANPGSLPLLVSRRVAAE